MTVYDIPGPAGGANGANTELGSLSSAGSGNTLAVASEKVYSGSFSLKQTIGNPLAPTNPTTVSVWDVYATGVTGALPVTFGAPSDLTSGMTIWFHPAGGFKAASGGLTTIRQWYGGTDTTVGGVACRLQAADAQAGLTTSGSVVNQTAVAIGTGDKVTFTAVGAATNIATGVAYYVVNKTANAFGVSTTPGGTALVLGTASGIAYAQALRFSNNANNAVLGILGNLDSLAGHWVGVRHQLSLGAAASGGRALFRAYDLGTEAAPLYPAAGSFIVNTDVSTPAVTGTGAAATGGIDLGGTGGVLNKVTRWRGGISSLPALPYEITWDYFVETTGSLQWVAGPAASAAPDNSAITLSNSYPADGETVTLTVTGVTGATSRTVSFAAPPSNHPIYGRWSDQVATPRGTTAPTVQTATPTTTTTIGPVRAGQTWVRVRSVGTGGTTDSYHPIWTHAVVNVDVKPQKVYATGYTTEGGGTAEDALSDALASTRIEGPLTPTTSEYILILWEPMPLGTVKPYLDYGRKVNTDDVVSGLRWRHQLLGEDGVTVIFDFPSWDNTAAEAGQQLTRSFDAGVDVQNALATYAAKRALTSKIWATVI